MARQETAITAAGGDYTISVILDQAEGTLTLRRLSLQPRGHEKVEITLTADNFYAEDLLAWGGAIEYGLARLCENQEEETPGSEEDPGEDWA